MELEVWSPRLGESVRLVVAGAGERSGGSTVVWLLHGRGTSYDGLRQIVADLHTACSMTAGAAGRLPPLTVVAPWAPWSDGASWWVDAASPGLPVETALLDEVLPQAEASLRIGSGGDDRLVAGYSMGGAAALRWLLTRRDLFSGAALVSPAAYAELPPTESSARTSGAFSGGTDAFDLDRWRRLMSYRRLLAADPPPRSPLTIGIVVGDGEPLQDYGDGRSSLTLEAARLHTVLRDHPGVTSSLRVVAGGHDDGFWAPALTTAFALVRPGC